MPHFAQQPLQDAHGIGPGVDVHIEHRRVQTGGQFRDQGAFEVVADEDVDRLRPCQPLHIGCVHITVGVQIQPQAPHGVDGDAKIGRPARIVGVVHIATLAGDDFLGDVCDGLHGQPLLLLHLAQRLG